MIIFPVSKKTFVSIYRDVSLRQTTNTHLRSGAKVGFVSKVMQRMLNLWFRRIDNNINFGFGLSVVFVGRK